MIKRNDYVIIDDFGYKCICRIVLVGHKNRNIRNITVLMVHPNIGKELYNITVDSTKVVILDEKQIRFVKCLYE